MARGLRFRVCSMGGGGGGASEHLAERAPETRALA